MPSEHTTKKHKVFVSKGMQCTSRTRDDWQIEAGSTRNNGEDAGQHDRFEYQPISGPKVGKDGEVFRF